MKYTLERIKNIFDGTDKNPHALENLRQYWSGPSYKERDAIIQQCTPTQAFALEGLQYKESLKVHTPTTFDDVFSASTFDACQYHNILVLANRKNIHYLNPEIISKGIQDTQYDSVKTIFWEYMPHNDDLYKHVLGQNTIVWREYVQHCDMDPNSIETIFSEGSEIIKNDIVCRTHFQERIVKTALYFNTYHTQRLSQYVMNCIELPKMIVSAILENHKKPTSNITKQNIYRFLKTTYGLLKNTQQENQYRSIEEYLKLSEQKYDITNHQLDFNLHSLPKGLTDPVLTLALETSLSSAKDYLTSHAKMSSLELEAHELGYV